MGSVPELRNGSKHSVRWLPEFFIPFLLLIRHTSRGEGGGQDVLEQEGLAQAEARCYGAYHGDERIPNGYLAHWIAGKQFIVEGKSMVGCR